MMRINFNKTFLKYIKKYSYSSYVNIYFYLRNKKFISIQKKAIEKKLIYK